MESAFCKAFSPVFQKGSPPLEKTFRKEEILADRRGSRSELRYMKKSAGYANPGNLTMTAVEGILGGAANGIYDQKGMRSVDVKYRKRYLWQILKQERTRK